MEERKSGRADATEVKFVPGKPPDMARHVASCLSVSDSVKAFVSQSMKDKIPTDRRGPLMSQNYAARSGSGMAAPATGRLGPISGNKRKQVSVSDYGVHGKHYRLDTDEHARLIADAISASKVLFQFFFGDIFRRLQEFYVGGNDMLRKYGLIVNAPKIRNQILPLRYSEAFESLQSRLSNGPLADGYTLADDGCASRRKAH
jgi:hypothetical protein